MTRVLLAFFFFALLSLNVQGQVTNYTTGGLSVDVFLSNPCEGSSNGYILFTVLSTSNNASAQLQLIIGPPNLFVVQSIAVGSSYKFNASETLPVSDGYEFVIADPNGTDVINTFGSPVMFTALPDIVITDDGGNDLTNSSCTTPDGKIAVTISGGSKALAGGGLFTYNWSTTNGLAGFPVKGVTDGNSMLDLATLAGLSGLPGGDYTLVLSDSLSKCFETKSWTITDPQPALQAITNGNTQTVCQGTNATILLGGSEIGVDYDVLVNGVFSGVSVPGTGAPLNISVPAGLFLNGQTLIVRARLGSCTSLVMTGFITMTVNPLPTIVGVSVAQICEGVTTTNLTYTSTTGTPDQYSIDFDAAAEAQGFVDVVNAALPVSPIPITVPGAAAPATYNATLTVTNGGTGCISLPQAISLTINPASAITLGPNPAVCIGSVAASLSYLVASGSPDQYSIDFDPAAEAQGFVDVVNAALPATPITVVVPGAAIAGTYNATITVRNSLTSCGGPGSAFTITINPNPTITLGANPVVCSGTTTALLTYGATTGSPDRYSIDFNAAAEAQGFVDVVNAVLPATPINIVVPGAAVAGVYNATITVSNNATTCTSAPTPITVTVNATPTIALGANPSVCSGSTTALLSYGATTGSPNQYSIDFDAAAEAQGFVDIVNAALPATPISIVVPGAALAGTYNAIITVRNSVTTCASAGSPITVTISPNPTIALGANPDVCSGSTTALLSYGATTGGPDRYSIDFNAAAEAQGFVDVVNAVLPATPISIVVPGAALAGVYNATITVSNSATTCVSAGSPITITIDPNPTIALGANPSVCSGSTTALLSYGATTGSPDQYSIDFNAAAEAQGFVDVVNAPLPATPISIVVPGAALAGVYNATITVSNSAASAASPISITINPNPTIALGANPSVCSGSTTALLSYGATTGSPNRYSIDFDAAAEAQGFVDIVNAALPATPISIVVPGAALAGTYNATITVRNNATTCASVPAPITITINPNPTIALGANPTVCSGSTTALLSYGATTGSPDQYSIDFNAAAEAQGFVDVVNAALPATPISIVVPGAAAAGVYNATITVRNSGSTCASAGTAISITVTANPTIALGPNPSVCSGSTTALLTYGATTGGPDQYSIDFDAAAEAQGFVDVVNAVLTATPISIVVPGAALAGTYNATITVRNSASTCVSSASAITITIDANPTIALGANPTVCSGSTTALLSYGAVTGSPDTYSIDFDAVAEAQGFVDVVNAALPATPISVVVPGAAIAGTYNATFTVVNSASTCASTGTAISITITPNPTITLGANPTVCSGSTTALLSYGAVTGSPDQYSIDFDAAAEAQGFVDVVNAALPATPISIVVPGAAVAGTYNATITIRNSASTCVSPSTAINVTIDPNPTITLGANPSVCSGSTTALLSYGATTGSPDQYSIDFDAAAEAQGFVDIVDAALPITPISIVVPGAALAGTYNATITVRNSASTCVSTGTAISVTIDPNPTITLGANPVVCSGSTTALLSYSATTGGPDQYSIDFDAAAEAQGFVDVINAALTATPISIVVPGAALAGTYNATITVLNSASSCTSSSAPISVTIEASPTIALGAITAVCSGTATTLQPYGATTGSPDQYSIDFNAAAEAQGFVDVINAALPATPISITVPPGALAGTYNGTLSVTNSITGCSSVGQVIAVTISSGPTATITGTTSICNGTPTNITINFTGTGPWAFQFSDGTTISPVIPSFFSSLVFPVSPSVTTTYTVVSVSDITACPGTPIGSAVVTVNVSAQTNLPVGVSIDPVCTGGISDVTVSNSEVGVSYQLRNDADDSPVGAPVVGTGATINLSTGALVATQTFNVLATSGGCPPVELTNKATVNVAGAINAGLAVTAAANPLCAGDATNIQIANSENGVLYQLRNDADDSNIGAVVAGTGGAIDLPTGNLAVTTTFNVLATNGTCSIELTDIEIVDVGPAPDPSLAVAVTIDPLCVGGISEVTVAGSEVGISYQLRNDGDDSAVGGPVAGTGATISLSTGVLNVTTTFNVLATSVGCPPVELTTLATVNVSGIVDASLAVTAAADPVCEGTSTDIQVANSEVGVSYQLRDDATDALVGAPVAGTGAMILLPTGNLAATTTFNVLASNGTCSIELTNTQTVNVDVAPDPSLTVGVSLDPLCVGGVSSVTVALSQVGVTYQLRNDADDSTVGAAVPGTGATISMSTGVLNATTVFNVLATSGVCPPVELSTLATVNVAGAVNAGLTVTSSANPICAGGSSFIQVQASEVGVTYQLRDDLNDAPIGAPVAGNGATINLPTGNILITTTYNVVASNGSCSIELTDLETITVNPGPALNLSVMPASALICPGTSTNIVVGGSEVGVSYQLRNNSGNTPIGSPVAGTGGNILLSTGNLAANTTFNVFATSGLCAVQLSNMATVTVRLPGDPACGGGGGGTDCTNFSSIQPTIITQPSCNDRDAGIVSFTIARADGTPTTFRVIWSFNGTSQTKFTTGTVAFNDLSSGLYQYTVIDEGNGKSCGPVDFFLDLKTQVTILDKQVIANVTCFGGSDGNVIMSVDGTTTGEYWYKYVLNGVESGAQTFTPGAPLPGGLPADDSNFIIIKVDDTFSFSCPDTVMVRIRHTFPKIDFSVSSGDVTTCNGTDGSIQVAGIGGGDSGANPLQIRLKKAVPFSTDPSGYIVLVDFEDVVAGVKDYATLSQGNYIVDVRDHLDCIQSKPIAVQAPGQVPLSSVTVTATDASCANDGASGSIKVIITDAGAFQVALSQDQVNVPADDQFIDYNSPGTPSITFGNLSSGFYYLYFKSSTTTCPTRTDAIAIGGVQSVNGFEVVSQCENLNLVVNNISGQQDAPFVIRVFSNSVQIDSLTSPSIPLSRSVTFVYNPPLQHSFLSLPGTYSFVMVQQQTTGAGTCTLVSEPVVYDVRLGLGIVLGEVNPSFPNPKRTGSIEIENIVGGTRFLSEDNELYYEISLYQSDDILVFDWEEVKLNPQNKFSKLYDYLPPGNYRVKVRDYAGCVISIDVEISLDPSLYIPNIFTPNADNVNDEFEILNLPLTGKHRLIVSNRWGNEVFTSKDYREGTFWNADGTSDGIYFYRLQVEGGETYTGWVEILRGSKP